jgi:hypothetical protein
MRGLINVARGFQVDDALTARLLIGAVAEGAPNMNIFRARHDNMPESPVRRLYGRKGNLLLVPLDVCLLQEINGVEEFRPPPERGRLIAAPILEEGGGRVGLIAQYEWPPRNGRPVNPVVTVQLAPSANIRGIEDLRVIASQFAAGDRVVLQEDEQEGGDPAAAGRTEGVILAPSGRHEYPDLMHRERAYAVAFGRHVERRAHGAAVRLETGELLGMLIATQNQPDGACRALVYPA